MKSILVIGLLLVLGIGGGVGAGMMLAPEPEPTDEACDAASGEECPSAQTDPEDPAFGPLDDPPEGASFDYVQLANQFVIPVVRNERVHALVVISVTLEVDAGANEIVFEREPRIRDAFLQEMFDFAYLGGFDGPFTKRENLATLRKSLREIGQRIVGPEVRDVLIIDLVRQEV